VPEHLFRRDHQGVAKIYQRTVIEAHSSHVFAKLYLSKVPMTAVDVVHRYFLLQYKQQFRTRVARQAFGHLLTTCMNPRITEFSQLPRIMLSGHDRPYDRLPVRPFTALITFANCTFICVNAYWIS
jgi:hypothetical protein